MRTNRDLDPDTSASPEPGEPAATLSASASVDSAVESEAESETDAILREMAYAPPRRPPGIAVPGSCWGESGRYVIDRLLGRGGMGTVYAATDTLLGRRVALKLLDLSEADDDSGRSARILREARLAALVEHERIARIYDVGAHHGFAFVAMEYVEGGTLRQWMAGGPASLADVLDIAIQIADGLAALHAKQVVHRDLKPENVMMSMHGGVKLVDFGLARHAVIAAHETGVPGVASATQGGASTAGAAGTPGYMAPEQCEGKPVDARIDIFALGVIVCELVTGERPFRGADPEAIRQAMLSTTGALSHAAWTTAPERLRAHAARMLARDPMARFPDGHSALTALEEVAAGASLQRRGGVARRDLADAPVAPAVKRPSRRARYGMVAALLAGGAVTAGVLRSRSPALEPPIALAGMVWLPGGRFVMGSTPAQIAAACTSLGAACRPQSLEREQPAHTVSLSPYYLDEREVTNDEFAQWLKSSAPWPTVDPDPQIHEPVLVHDSAGTLLANLHAGRSGIVYTGRKFRARDGYGHRAVVQVTWDGARMYCATQGKRLPTEAEWEYAARGSAERPYPWGSEAPRCDGVVYARHDGARCEALGAGATDVDDGPQDRTPDGIRGLGGNVAEWVFDAFEQPFHPPCGECRDPRFDVARPGPEEQRVYRGGSWGATAFTRATARGHWSRIDTADNIGFRCAADDPRVKHEES